MILTRSFVPLALAALLACRGESGSAAPAAAQTTAAPPPLAPGDAAPDVSALSHTGYSVKLADFRERPAAIYFCPAGFDAACSALVRALRDRWLTLNQRLSMVLVAVPSGYIENKALATAEELPFLLLADSERALARSFGVPAPTPGLPAPPRGFVVGTDGRITKVFDSPSAGEHVAALAATLPAQD